MPINSKQKGNGFERKIATILSDRFAEWTGKTASFRRNADSGSFFGGSNQTRTESHDLSKAEFGDIISPLDFKYSLECKFYKTPPSFSMILQQDCKMFDEWIKKVEQDAANADRLPCIIMKFNKVQETVMVRELTGVEPVFHYKAYHIVTLKNFLTQPSEWFFKK
jgi:hypothetical protein